MRTRKTSQGLTVQATAGSHVVMLGFDLAEALCPGLKGFAIHRTDHTEGEAYWLRGLKSFEATDPGFPVGATYSTRQHPIQGFTWSDFTAKPGHRYTYRVEALTGPPEALQTARTCEVAVRTESTADTDHTINFNRGASATQEYERRFGNSRPLSEAGPDDPRWAWLSRGAHEALLGFVARALGAGWGLRVAAYEFRLSSFADALGAAADRGADVLVLFDANANPPDSDGRVAPRDANRATAQAAGIEHLCHPRITRADVRSPPIAHHKFIVLTRDGKAQAVLTGSTNFTPGGVFGQANVVHVVDNARVADEYLAVWNRLQPNPPHGELRDRFSAENAIPTGLTRRGSTVWFSPQRTSAALRWYEDRARTAPRALFMTFAFGMGEGFRRAYAEGEAGLRYALLERLIASGVRADRRAEAEAEMNALRAQVANRFAVGNLIATNSLDRWVRERLTGLNTFVSYVHTKFMLVDPLSDDPLVVTGSANFSEASTTANDENMLLIRGNRRVADIYLGEYMRLWNHFAFREWVAETRGRSDGPHRRTFKWLDVTDAWWRGYFGDSARSRQRRYFSGGADA
jgi:phosphatidylserine/phosphatidylglycerophosphate/cardiolipin synthase-like enzyme